MSATARGALGGLVAALLFSCTAIMGSGTPQAQMFGVVLVTPAMALLGTLLGVVVGLVVGRVQRVRHVTKWKGALLGLALGVAIGCAMDLVVNREIDVQDGLFIITAWFGLLAGGYASRASS